MPHSALILYLSDTGANGLSPTLLYGCMMPAQGSLEQTRLSDRRSTVAISPVVRELRFSVNDVDAAAFVAGLKAGTLDLTAFGLPDNPFASSLPVEPIGRFLRLDDRIARRQIGSGLGIGTPPGFLTSPTIVDLFMTQPRWAPPPVDLPSDASVGTLSLPVPHGRAILEAMAELSGLPFAGPYAQIASGFEIMSPVPGHDDMNIDCRFMHPARYEGDHGALIVVSSSTPGIVRILLRQAGETLLDRTTPMTPPGITVRHPTPGPVDEIQVQIFEAGSGDLVLHRSFTRAATIDINAHVIGQTSTLFDELARRAPLQRRHRISTVTRTSVETMTVGDRSLSSHEGRLRRLAGTAYRPASRAEWFPRGIDGEIDVVDRIRSFADAPQVAQILIVDPFLSPSTLTRLVRRIGRQDVEVVAISSVLDTDPDEFGKPADAVNLLRTTLDEMRGDFACSLRVVNLAAVTSSQAGGLRPVGQAFHDRYLRIRLRDGSRSVLMLGNSLNKAAGNWPFVMAELSDEVATQVDAYIEALLTATDPTGRLQLGATLNWSNQSQEDILRRRPGSTGLRFGPRICLDVLRTLRWLRGEPDWSTLRRLPGRVGQRRELVGAFRARLLLSPVSRGTRIRLRENNLVAAARRQFAIAPPATPDELATLLRGFGEICAWSGLQLEDVGQFLRSRVTRTMLPRALNEVAGAVPLTIAGSDDLEREDLERIPLGRKLVWFTEATIGAPWDFRSPDYRLSGGMRIALAIDPSRATKWIDANGSDAVRTFGRQLVLLDFEPGGQPRTFPDVLRARSNALRTAGLLHMYRDRSEGGLGLSGDEAIALLRRSGWAPEQVSWGMTVGYERAVIASRTSSVAGGPVGAAARVMDRLRGERASAVARSWPAVPGDDLLDDVCDLLDTRHRDIVQLAEVIADNGKDASGLWRRSLQRFDRAIMLEAFEPADPVDADLATYEREPDVSAARDAWLWSAVAYVELTGARSLTRLASRYLPLLVRCEADLLDPLVRRLDRSRWKRQVTRLALVYSFVYRILDEASRRGATDGATHFADDVGKRVDNFLEATAGSSSWLQDKRALLVRDRGRTLASGVATVASSSSEVADYLRVTSAAAGSVPDFSELETMLVRTRARSFGRQDWILATLSDILECYIFTARSTAPVDAWWRSVTARSELPDLAYHADFVTRYDDARSTIGDRAVTGLEEQYGFRFGPA